MSETVSSSVDRSSLPSDEVVSATMQKGLEEIIVSTGVGLVIGGLASVVLARGGGGSAARKAIAGFGGGIGLGSSWTKVSMELENILLTKSPSQEGQN